MSPLISAAAKATYLSGSLNSSISLYTSLINPEVASGEKSWVPASNAIPAATHGMVNPLLCLVTTWLPLNKPGPPPP